MDYDYPPTPEPPVREEEPLRLRQKLAATAMLYAVIWAAGALLLHAIAPYDVRVHTPAPSGHGADVTTTLPPHPATSPNSR
jgi:hypothetical protein